MVRTVLPSLLHLVLLCVATFGIGESLVGASPSGHAPHGTVTIDGITVPDIGPLLPTAVPIPSSNVNYAAKIELGKQLYFDGRLSKTTRSPARSVITQEQVADSRQTSISVGGGIGGHVARPSTMHRV